MFSRNIYKMFKILTAPSRKEVPFKHIVQIGDPVLRTVASPVRKEDMKHPEIIKIIQYLKAMTYKGRLFGLSAPQIGIPLQIISLYVPPEFSSKHDPEVIRREIEPLPLQIWINPQVTVTDFSYVIHEELCESILGFSAEIKRHRKVLLCGLDEKGENKKMEASGWTARIIQHEMDHLNGVMFVDKMSPVTFKNTAWQDINQCASVVELRYGPII